MKYGRYLLESFVTLHRHATDDGVNIAFSVLSSWVSLRSDEELRLRLLSCSVVYYYFSLISVPVPPIKFVLGRFDDLVETLFLFL